MTKNYEIIDGRCVIPHGIIHIVYKEFESAHGLREVVISTSVDMICAYAFSDCLSLTGIELPYSLTAIGREAFSYCEKLIRPEIPAGVTCIGEDAFFLPKDWDQDELPF